LAEGDIAEGIDFVLRAEQKATPPDIQKNLQSESRFSLHFTENEK